MKYIIIFFSSLLFSLILTPIVKKVTTRVGIVSKPKDFNKMYHAHIKTSAEMTMATYTHTVEIPFGVIQAQNNRIISIDEKPSVDFLINAGIYILFLHPLWM